MEGGGSGGRCSVVGVRGAERTARSIEEEAVVGVRGAERGRGASRWTRRSAAAAGRGGRAVPGAGFEVPGEEKARTWSGEERFRVPGLRCQEKKRPGRGAEGSGSGWRV